MSTAGLVLTLVQLGIMLRGRGAVADSGSQPQLGGVTVLDEEEAQEQDVEYVFANAGAKAWREALVWIAIFFGGPFVFGLYIVVPLFCVAYLRLVARSSWLASTRPWRCSSCTSRSPTCCGCRSPRACSAERRRDLTSPAARPS